LLSNIPTLETELLATMAGPESASKLKAIDWGEVCAQVYLPRWTSLVEANSAVLSGLTPEALAGVAGELPAFGLRCRTPEGEPPDQEHAARLASAVVGAALTLLLVDQGGQADSLPGEEVWVRLREQKVKTFLTLPSLADGKLAAADWQRQCEELGILGCELSRPPATVDATQGV
jgi:hypothetical protein